jgi:flagellar protein FliO/FliZ
MLRARHETRSGRPALVSSWLVRALGTGLVVAMVTFAARPALGDASGAADARGGQPIRSKPARLSGLAWLRGGASATGSDNWGAGTACLALVLAICGGLAVAARRLGPRAPAAPVQVVGRVSLSPKHSVYLLRVGRRVLVVGAGPQGPPALITELVDEPQEPPAPQRGAES